MNEAYEAKRKQREEHLKAVLCGLFIKFSEDMESYSAAVKAFEAFRKRMICGRPVQKAAWLHSLITSNQSLVSDKDTRKITAEFWKWDEDYYNAQWLVKHSQDWKLFVSKSSEYYNRLKDASYERKEMDHLADVCIIPKDLVNFISRQRSLAEVSGEILDTAAAYRYAIVGYTYGIRTERARRRGSKIHVPVVRRPHYDRYGHRLRKPWNEEGIS